MNDFETVRSHLVGSIIAREALDRIETEVERLQREKQGWVNQAAVEEKERLDAEAEVKRLRAALEHGIIAYAGLKQFAEQQLGKPIQGGVWPEEARAALAKEEA